MTGLAAAVETGRLKVAKGLPYGDALVRELRAFKRTIASPRHASFAGAGEHDDLVIAVALVVWWRAIGRRHTQTARMAHGPLRTSSMMSKLSEQRVLALDDRSLQHAQRRER